MMSMMNMTRVPTIYCEHSQSIWEAAIEHGYAPPEFRVGAHQSSPPADGETLVAMVKAHRHSIPLPIFRKEVMMNDDVGGSEEAQVRHGRGLR